MEKELINGKELKKSKASKKRKTSKALKKSFKILLIVLIATVYFNVGWYYGVSFDNALTKYIAGGQLNTFESFQSGPWKFWIKDDGMGRLEGPSFYGRRILTIVFWPITLFFNLSIWLVYGIVCAFNFIFLGGAFRLVYPLIT